jgi:hypothetical protein
MTFGKGNGVRSGIGVRSPGAHENARAFDEHELPAMTRRHTSAQTMSTMLANRSAGTFCGCPSGASFLGSTPTIQAVKGSLPARYYQASHSRPLRSTPSKGGCARGIVLMQKRPAAMATAR